MSAAFELQSKVEELKEVLLTKHPKMPGLLREIFLNLKKHPENVTILPEEDIAKIVAGLEVQTGVVLAAAVSKPKAGNIAALKKKIETLGEDAF